MARDKKDIDVRRKEAAARARAEAADRRAAQHQAARPHEEGGRDGPEPTRYGDWEKQGIISDF
jgi:hypothetical protein